MRPEVLRIEPPDPALDDALPEVVRDELVHLKVRRPWGHQHLVTTWDPERDARDRPVILLVHGWPQHWFVWRGVLADLMKDHLVVAVDLRGMGWSSTSGDVVERTSIVDMADDVVGALDALDVPVAAMAAHDWGGWIGFRAVQRHPTRFTAYAGLAIMPPWLDRWSMIRGIRGWGYVYGMAARGDRVARSANAVDLMFRMSATVRWWEEGSGPLARRSYLDRIATGSAPGMTRHLYRSLVGRELPAAFHRPRAGRFPVPATVIGGMNETISVPQHWWGRTFAGEVALETIPGARHWLAEEAPGLTAQALRKALDVEREAVSS